MVNDVENVNGCHLICVGGLQQMMIFQNIVFLRVLLPGGLVVAMLPWILISVENVQSFTRVTILLNSG